MRGNCETEQTSTTTSNHKKVNVVIHCNNTTSIGEHDAGWTSLQLQNHDFCLNENPPLNGRRCGSSRGGFRSRPRLTRPHLTVLCLGFNMWFTGVVCRVQGFQYSTPWRRLFVVGLFGIPYGTRPGAAIVDAAFCESARGPWYPGI